MVVSLETTSRLLIFRNICMVLLIGVRFDLIDWVGCGDGAVPTYENRGNPFDFWRGGVSRPGPIQVPVGAAQVRPRRHVEPFLRCGVQGGVRSAQGGADSRADFPNARGLSRYFFAFAQARPEVGPFSRRVVWLIRAEVKEDLQNGGKVLFRLSYQRRVAHRLA